MKLSEFSFDVPDELIAQHPLAQRSDSRLMVLDGGSGDIQHSQFAQIATFLKAGDRLVLNNTKVIPARLFGQKSTGGKVELMVERVTGERQALTKIRASKAPKAGAIIELSDHTGLPAALNISLRVEGRTDDLFQVSVVTGPNFDELLQQLGSLPLPPYITRTALAADDERYQTVYASEQGAVAAPTAGLHFTEELLETLQKEGVDISYVTLHVGAGTFQPVRTENLDDHIMHAERAEISESTVTDILETRAKGGRIVAVGTTSVRTLEAASHTGTLQAMNEDTRLFLRPGYRFKTVDGMITNFHLSQSTLLMLVSAFAGTRHILRAYEQAVKHRYRFFSYGDAMLLWPHPTTELESTEA